MINSETAKALSAYGEKTICYTLNGKNCSDQNTSLAITKAVELCELDGGRELMRTGSKALPGKFELHGQELKFNIIYATPDTKELAKQAAKKYRAALVMIYE